MIHNTRMIFIRHGEVENPQRLVYGRTIDVPLSETGFEQVKKVAQRIKDQGLTPDIIYTSPLTRAIQSSQVLTRVFPGVKEYRREELLDTDEAVLADKTLEWLAQVEDEYSFPGVESPEHIVQRMQLLYNEVLDGNRGRTIFFVGHGDPIAFFVWHLLHKGEQLPSIKRIQEDGMYPKKAEAWEIAISPAGGVQKEIKIYSPETDIIRRRLER